MKIAVCQSLFIRLQAQTDALSLRKAPCGSYKQGKAGCFMHYRPTLFFMRGRNNH